MQGHAGDAGVMQGGMQGVIRGAMQGFMQGATQGFMHGSMKGAIQGTILIHLFGHVVQLSHTAYCWCPGSL